jgi:phage baseplate assembly protein W
MKSQRREINKRYKDIDLDMIVHPHTNDIVGRYDDEALTGSILNIIKTRKGERVFQPDFGSTIYNSLFDPFCNETRVSLQTHIENALTQHEPRIVLNYVKIKAEVDMNMYNVAIAYTPVIGGGMREIEFFLNRLR